MFIIEKYFPGLTPLQRQQFRMLPELYHYWNARINVISRKDLDNLYERHVLHSLAIARIIRFSDKTGVLDAGTGGGFPGIPLAILFPRAHFLLADSVAKKINVVNGIVHALNLENVHTVRSRIENIDGRFDFIVSRAVTALPVFVKWCEGKIRANSYNGIPNGIIYLKGGDIDDELAQTKKNYRVYPVSRFFDEPFFETKKVVHIW